VFRFLRNVLHPARYHGRLRGQRPPFFEGWYYKVVDPTGHHRFAFIPGVFWTGRPHTFVQWLDGASGVAQYHDFPVEAFWAANDRFEVHVAGSRFTHQEMTLLIDRPQQHISGALRFGDTIPWPVTVASPGIMGWYAWVPFMECYHGVLSFDHAIYGALNIDGREIDFTGGRGYIEKDWGRSFPQAWIWFQSNHFERPGICLTASIAIIPWVRTSFPGFIIGLWADGRLFRFATYTGAKVERLDVTDRTIEWVVSDKTHRLEIFVTQGEGSTYGLLKGPDRVEMGKRIAETMSATVQARLTDGAGGVLIEGTGHHAGLEVHEVENRLLKMVKEI
jgi:hypothetical protein